MKKWQNSDNYTFVMGGEGEKKMQECVINRMGIYVDKYVENVEKCSVSVKNKKTRVS